MESKGPGYFDRGSVGENEDQYMLFFSGPGGTLLRPFRPGHIQVTTAGWRGGVRRDLWERCHPQTLS